MRVTNKLGLPQPLVDAVTREHRRVPRRYSVTELQKGVREAILARRHDGEIECDVSEMVWAIFGTAVHSVLENARESETQLKESKLVQEMPNGYELSGIFDLYDDSTGTVTDYKTASVWKVKFGDYSDWREQTLMYCWMLRRLGFDAKRGEVVAMLKDHSKTKAKVGDHPPLPVFTVGWDFDEKDIDDIGMWLEDRFNLIAACEELPDEKLPMCSDEERWHRPGKFAVMKPGRKSALKLFDDEDAAWFYAEEKGGGCWVQHRPGEDRKCMEYCAAAPFCAHGKELLEDGR